MKILAVVLLVMPLVSGAFNLTLESGVGHQGEMQYRAGAEFQLSRHWELDSGLSAVRYKDEHYDHLYAPAGASGHVFAVDAVLLRKIGLRDDFRIVLGSGPAVWNHAAFGAQRHGHAWMFSNRIGLEYEVSNRFGIGLGVRHYSCLWCRPNTSIDFVGLQGILGF